MLRLVISAWLIILAGPLSATELEFDLSQHIDEVPPGFRSTLTGVGKPGEWRVIMDEAPTSLAPLTPNAPIVTRRAVLAQLDRNPTAEHFPLLIYEKETFGDFTMSARFKTVGGAVEQMAGLAFRIQDETNYYYVRASSLGNTFRFYKIVNGERSPPIGAAVEIPKGVWHELSLTCKGNSVRCLLNGKEIIPPFADDTFSSGKIGFWTKSDSVSYFTDIKINYSPRVILAQTLVKDIVRQYPRLLGLKIYAAAGKDLKVRSIASLDEKELGQPGGTVEQDVIARSTVYYGKEKDSALVTLPLHDRNGDTIAAVRVVMKSFAGQTEENAIARALPIVKKMETRVRSSKELIQ
jgi:hypothetical protein